MGAECYWCKTSANEIVNPLGTINNPIGCCKKCQALICGHHGERDAVLHQFMCFDCDISILVNSAVQAAQNNGANLVFTSIEPFDVFVDFLFKSFEEFKLRRPGYNGWFADMENKYFDFSQWDDDDPIRIFLMNTAKYPTGRELLRVAAYILQKMYNRVTDLQQRPAYYEYLFKALR